MEISYKFLPNEQKNFFYSRKNNIQKNSFEHPYQLEIDNYNYYESNNNFSNEYKGFSLFPKKNFQKSSKKKKQNQIFENLDNKKKVKKKGKNNKKTENKNEKINNQDLNQTYFKETKTDIKKKENDEMKTILNNSDFLNDFNQSNVNQKNSFLKYSPKLSLFKENESENTTSFTTGNNLSPSESHSFTNNPELNSKLLFQKKQISNSVENIFKDDTNYNNGNNYNNVIIFPQDKKKKKKPKKKKKKNKNISTHIHYNIFNEYNIHNGHNDLVNLYSQCLSKINVEKVYPNLNKCFNNYNIYPQNYNIIEKTVKKEENFSNNKFSIQELNNNNSQINQFQNLNFNNNNIMINIKESQKENKKKYIYMRDIIVNYPKKLNPKTFKPFIMKKIEKEKEIILNLKIKIDDKGNEIHIAIREGENPLNILDNLLIKINLNEDKMKRISYEIQNTLNVINNFKNLFIRNNSYNIMNEVNNYINRNCNKDFYDKSILFFNKNDN